LRMIAGLEPVTSGEIWIGDRRVDQIAPGAREVSMVFQSYALYPHMTVRENMAFGLKNIGTPQSEIKRRIAETAQILEMAHLLDRPPAQLSGGQRQRVAVGRAIVREPKLFLFDEPFSNLDSSLRVRTRVELAQLHQRLGTTMIFVTHDQSEAMTLASRIVLINNKRVEQCATPTDIYTRPATRYAAAFIGSPGMNFLPVVSLDQSDGLAVARMRDHSTVVTAVPAKTLPKGDLTLGVRPEHLIVSSAKGESPATAKIVERLGERTLVHLEFGDGTNSVAAVPGIGGIKAGDSVSVAIKAENACFFDAAGRAYHPGRQAP